MKIILSRSDIIKLIRPILAQKLDINESDLEIEFWPTDAVGGIGADEPPHARILTQVRQQFLDHVVPTSEKIACIKMLRDLSRTLPIGSTEHDRGLLGLADAKAAIEMSYDFAISYIRTDGNLHGIFNRR